MYCRSCGKQLHESARFCPQCGFNFEPVTVARPSIWMAVSALVLAILTLLILLSTIGDMDTLSRLSHLESAFGGNSLQKKVAEEAGYSAIGGLVFCLSAAALGILSLARKRGGRGMAITSVVINGINLLIILSLFGLSLQ